MGPVFFFSVAFAEIDIVSLPHVCAYARHYDKIRLTAVKKNTRYLLRRRGVEYDKGSCPPATLQWGRAGMALHTQCVEWSCSSARDYRRQGTHLEAMLPSMLEEVTIVDHRASSVSLPVTISASVWPQKFRQCPSL